MKKTEDNLKIKQRIQSILSRSIENGFTEAEAIEALEKASKLMMQHFISHEDLQNLKEEEKPIALSVPRLKNGFDLTYGLANLATLFDCKSYFNKDTVTFFGFPQDVKFCKYFYPLIIKSCLADLRAYWKTEKYQLIKNSGIPGKTISAQFIQGYLYSVAIKMTEIYENRNSTIPKEYSLMIISKKNMVEQEYKELEPARKKRNKSLQHGAALNDGLEKGNDFQITQALNESKEELGIKLLN